MRGVELYVLFDCAARFTLRFHSDFMSEMNRTHKNTHTQAHFEDKASWFRNRRESRVRFTNRFELRISK